MGKMSYSMATRTGRNDDRYSYMDEPPWEKGESEGAESTEQENVVLLVADDDIFLKAMKNHLKRRVSAVYTADSPTNALSILGHLSVNVLVCDFDLGREDITGVELVNLIRKKFPRVKRAVICSASEPSDIPPSPYVDDFVNKTTDLAKLRLLVQKPL